MFFTSGFSQMLITWLFSVARNPRPSPLSHLLLAEEFIHSSAFSGLNFTGTDFSGKWSFL